GFMGSEQRFSTTTRSAPASASATNARSGASAASNASPGTSTSASPAPATVNTEKPSWDKAHCHLAASTDTPSAPPKRYETMAPRIGLVTTATAASSGG